MENGIDIKNFSLFLFTTFSSQITFYEEFLPILYFVEIDCFSDDFEYKLSIEISDEAIKFALITKEPSIDFSLYDYVMNTNLEAEEFVKIVKHFGWPDKH